MDDLVSDVRITVGLLHESQRVKECQALIERVIRKFLKLERASKDQIYSTDHSLGAGVASIIGKHVAASTAVEGHKYETHIFNPPSVTISSILNGKAIPPGRETGSTSTSGLSQGGDHCVTRLLDL